MPVKTSASLNPGLNLRRGKTTGGGKYLKKKEFDSSLFSTPLKSKVLVESDLFPPSPPPHWRSVSLRQHSRQTVLSIPLRGSAVLGNKIFVSTGESARESEKCSVALEQAVLMLLLWVNANFRVVKPNCYYCFLIGYIEKCNVALCYIGHIQ